MRRGSIGHALAFVATIALIVGGTLPPLHVHLQNPEQLTAPIEHWHFIEHHHHTGTQIALDDDDHDGPARYVEQSGMPAAAVQHVAPLEFLYVLRALIADPPDSSVRRESSWLSPPSSGPPPSPSLLRAPPPLA